MQCIVDIVWEYNHSKAAPQKLSFKDINKSTQRKSKVTLRWVCREVSQALGSK